MGTMSAIGKVNEDGSCDVVYCYHDGYAYHNGKILKENYTEIDKINELLELGSLYSLGKDTKETVAYCRDFGEEKRTASHFDNAEEIFEQCKENFLEFVYLFNNERWYCYITSSDRLLTVEDAILYDNIESIEADKFLPISVLDGCGETVEKEKKTFKIPVAYEMYGYVEIEATDIKEAIDKVQHDNDIGLPKASRYVEGTWEVDMDVVYEMNA